MVENVKRHIYIFLLMTSMASSFRPNNGLTVIKNNSSPINERTLPLKESIKTLIKFLFDKNFILGGNIMYFMKKEEVNSSGMIL